MLRKISLATLVALSLVGSVSLMAASCEESYDACMIACADQDSTCIDKCNETLDKCYQSMEESLQAEEAAKEPQ